MPTPCFLLEPNGQERVWLRRYASIAEPDRDGNPCGSYHDAVRFISDFAADEGPDEVEHEDARWPTHCDHCGYEFHPVEDRWQVFTLHLYEVTKSVDENYIRVGGVFHVHCNPVFEGVAPAGAMYYADWYAESFATWDATKPWGWKPGPDGRVLVCRVPPHHDWIVDSRASNCTKPDDNEHYCWVRSGEPPYVTAGKAGLTCDAGAGSIATPGYHGFLRDGVLT